MQIRYWLSFFPQLGQPAAGETSRPLDANVSLAATCFIWIFAMFMLKDHSENMYKAGVLEVAALSFLAKGNNELKLRKGADSSD